MATKEPLRDAIIDFLFTHKAFEDNPLAERHLADHFQTSRTPIRDALQLLELDGLVERRRKNGLYLKKPTPKLISDLYDVRIALEALAVRLAARTVTAAQIQHLERFAKRFDGGIAKQDFVEAERANIDFHTSLTELSGNELLVSTMEKMRVIRKAFQYAYSLSPEKQTSPSPYSHHDIISRLKAHDPDGGEELIKQHIQLGKQRMVEQALGFRMQAS